MKKAVLILAGVAVLAGAGYAAGNMLTKKTKKDNSVQLEDGRMVKMESAGKGGGAFDHKNERPDLVGQIKSIDGDAMVVEKFEMPSGGRGRGAGAKQDDEAADKPAERPEPTVAGEETITFSDDTSFVKGPERGTGRGRGQSKNVKLEDISKSDLSEGNMISVWTGDDGVAERIMVR